jgi:hypothetical protein
MMTLSLVGVYFVQTVPYGRRMDRG